MPQLSCHIGPCPRKTDFEAEWTKLLWPTFFAAEAGAAFARQMMEPSPRRGRSRARAGLGQRRTRSCWSLGAARLRRFGRPNAGAATAAAGLRALRLA